MPDLERRAITKFGLSFSEFWDSSPRELEMLIEASAFDQEMAMNRVRHLMATMLNTVVDKKKKPKGYSPQDIMHLPLIDGKRMDKEEAKQMQEEAENALAQIKKNWS